MTDKLTSEELLERIATTRSEWGEFGFWSDGTEHGSGDGDWITVADLLQDLVQPARWLHKKKAEA